MPSQKNIDELKNLEDKLSRAKAVALADYRGLSVNDLGQLRQQVNSQGGELKVIKNTLLRLAFGNRRLSSDINQSLEGPTLALFAYDDEVAPLKALADFAKEHELPRLKAGFLGVKYLNQTDLTQLASLPSRNVLLARTVGQLAAPLTSLVGVLSGTVRELVGVLTAIKEQKN